VVVIALHIDAPVAGPNHACRLPRLRTQTPPARASGIPGTDVAAPAAVVRVAENVRARASARDQVSVAACTHAVAAGRSCGTDIVAAAAVVGVGVVVDAGSRRRRRAVTRGPSVRALATAVHAHR